MEVFVKSFSTYRTIKHATVVSSSLVVDAIDFEKSEVVLKGDIVNRSDAGNWLVAEGLVFLISDVSLEAGQARLTLAFPLDVFARSLELGTQPNDQTIGGFIGSQMQTHWTSCDDPIYAMSYLVVSNLDTNPFVPPDVDSSGCFSLPDYCRLMRKSYRVAVRFEDGGSNLLCTVLTEPVVSRKIFFDDGQSQLGKATYSSSGLAKITVLHDIDTGERNEAGDPVYLRERTDWYLSESGDVSQLIPDRRASGQWKTIFVRGSEDVRSKVVEAFAKDRKNHKVEFFSTLDLAVHTDCQILVHGEVIRSYISYKRKNSADNRFYYKAGDLATTATEKLKGVLK